MSIDEKPVRRCAVPRDEDSDRDVLVSIDEKPVRRCASHVANPLKTRHLRIRPRAHFPSVPIGRAFRPLRVSYLALSERVSATRAPPVPSCTTFALVDTYASNRGDSIDFLIDATCQAHRRGRHIRGVDTCYTGGTIMQRGKKKSTV